MKILYSSIEFSCILTFAMADMYNDDCDNDRCYSDNDEVFLTDDETESSVLDLYPSYVDDDGFYDSDDSEVERIPVKKATMDHRDRIELLNKKYKPQMEECHEKIGHKLTWLDNPPRPAHVHNLRNVMEMTERLDAKMEERRLRTEEAAAEKAAAAEKMPCYNILTGEGMCRRRYCKFVHNYNEAICNGVGKCDTRKCTLVRRTKSPHVHVYENKPSRRLCALLHDQEMFMDWARRVSDYTRNRERN